MKSARSILFLLLLPALHTPLEATGTRNKDRKPALKSSPVEKALEFLTDENAIRKRLRVSPNEKVTRDDERLLLAIHQITRDSRFQKFREMKAVRTLLSKVLRTPLQTPRQAADLAVLLAITDARKYRTRITECALFLVNAQCADGGWSREGPGSEKYSKPSAWTLSRKKEKRFNRGPRPIHLRRMLCNPAEKGIPADTYAVAVAVFHFVDSTIHLPDKTLRDARKYWLEHQLNDGGWASKVGGTSTPAGTGAGIFSLNLYKRLCGDTDIFTLFENDEGKISPELLRGRDRLKRFGERANTPTALHALFMISLLTDTPLFHAPEKAREAIVGSQGENGSWSVEGDPATPLQQTFAATLILLEDGFPVRKIIWVDSAVARNGP